MAQMKSVTFIVGLSLVVLAANANVVSFIDPCHVNDDDCILASSKNALPYFAAGIPDIGISPADPLKLDTADGGIPGLNLGFTDLTIEGLGKCDLKHVKRPETLKIYVEAVCPIVVQGNYKVKGDMAGVPIHGEGPCNIKIGELWWEVTAYMKNVKGKDGQDYYKVSKFDYNYDPRSGIEIKLDNLYGGDADQETKSKTMHGILNEGGKDVIKTMGNDIISKLFEKEIGNISKFFVAVPAKEIEIA